MSYEKKISEKRVGEIIRLFSRDWTVGEIGDALRLPKGAVVDLLVHYGFDPCCERPKPGRKPLDFDVERALMMKREGRSYAQVARAFGTSKAGMRNRLKDLI